MKTVTIKGRYSDSKIYVGAAFADLNKYLRHKNIFIITDENVHRLYGKYFPPFPQIIVPAGEQAKKIQVLEDVFTAMVKVEVDRSWQVLGIGGGAVTDLTGLVSSLYMRGLKFSFVATTLMAQVDASIGGKNGVNFHRYKNLLGTINQPQFVLCDPLFFQTLSKKEISSGLAEVVKYCLLQGPKEFDYLLDHLEEVLALQPKPMEKLLSFSVNVKASIVNKDEHENDIRRLLNLGHTIGHALEKNSDSSHGEAVAIGLSAASHFSLQMNLLKEDERNRILQLLQGIGLQVSTDIGFEKIIEAVGKDKKRQAEYIHEVLLKGIGQPQIKKISNQRFQELVRNWLLDHGEG